MKLYLNDNWVFRGKDQENIAGVEVRLPHANIETPYQYFDESLYQFEAFYERVLFAASEWKGSCVFLVFEGVGHIAKVYVNDVFVGEHVGGYTGFRFDLAAYLHFGEENVIRVEVDSRESNNLPPFGKVIDYMTYGGIYREVYLEVKPQCHIQDVFVKTPKERVSLEISLSELKEEFEVKYEIRKVSEKSYRVLGQQVVKDSAIIIEETVQDVELWDVENPCLYELRVTLLHENEIVDCYETRFAFRTCEFRVDGFYLNDKKVKLRGLNRHQSYPYVGYAMPKRPQQLDADILRYELGLNAVRTSHYPQSQHFIDRCDEIGLLVFTEIPGWQHIGDDAWKEIACEMTREMVLQYRNHPSIILWGVRINESQDDDVFYQKTNKIAHDLDDTRQTGGVRFITKSNLLEDVYTFNDFSHTGDNIGLQEIKSVTSNDKKPYLVSEYNGHMFPTKAFDDESHRLEHAKRHANVLEAFYAQEDIAGAFGWCMFDYNTHKDFGSGDRICYHGVMTMFRNKKLAASVYASQDEKMPVLDISSSMNIGEHPGGYIGSVYAFTNADCVALYKNNKYVKHFYPKKDAKMPHSPIEIDDFIGGLIGKEGYSKKNEERIKQVLTGVARYGQNNLPLMTKLKMALVMLQEKLTFDDGMRLYYDYVGNWGDEATSYRFDAIKDEEVVATVTKSAVKIPQLQVDIDTIVLHEDTSYDVATLRIRAVDEHASQLMTYHGVVSIELSGPLKLIGPKTVSMTAGSTGTYIKTIGELGEANITIKADGMEPVAITVTVV
ncbi:MAG: glycoside hydrolase family 2 TIM barrel-domain containing protein [Lachnospiraceae bacterium]